MPTRYNQNEIGTYAKARIDRAIKISNSIDQNIYRLLLTDAMYRRCHFHKDLPEMLNNTLEARGLESIKLALLYELVIGLGRLIDSNKNAASLTNLFAILVDPGIKEALLIRSINIHLSIKTKFLGEPSVNDEVFREENSKWRIERYEKQAAAFYENLSLAAKKYNRLLQGTRIHRLRILRDKAIAHSELKEIRPRAKFGDGPYILSRLHEIFQTSALLLNSHHYNYGDSQRISQKYADRFWKAQIIGVKETKRRAAIKRAKQMAKYSIATMDT